ncbi:hypothetical protein FE257_004320 [Aspergillus nanangensis]|uniref:Cytokinesis regulator n=1 Tax=Aspergillus nanangensis TaxID=2582783 RepID=A0AAD4CC31_ASPNN|nr:hypothetical protein FE257_004320 [Aspergillus nanangensis]
MEPVTLRLKHGDEEAIECWDDDDDLQCYEDIQLRAASTATSVTNSSIRRSGHRDSISSRRSARSDLDSNAGADEDWQVQLLDNDDVANEEAIDSARNAGIPLPANVPRSALVGGTIKRLGRKKPRKDFIDDWSEDVELPDSGTALELKTPLGTYFPESLRQVSSAAGSPVKTSVSYPWDTDTSARLQSTIADLHRFRDSDFLSRNEDVPTIKAARSQAPARTNTLNDPRPEKDDGSPEDFEDDFELPGDNDSFRLSPRRPSAGASSPTPDEFDMEWSEGSIGIRFGGTTRDHPSNPSSSISALSPSASSCLTGESEDEGLDGLVIPDGPLDFDTPFKKRQNPSRPSVEHSEQFRNSEEPHTTDDFFSDLDVESGDAFDSKRLSINPNVKCKVEHPGSPARRSATTLTFTNTAVSPKTRIPRLSGHDRPHSTHLETVSESGAPLSKFRTSLSRASTHSPNPSASNLPINGPNTPTSNSSKTIRRVAGARLGKSSYGEVAGNTRQSLKTKRSMPTMRNAAPDRSPSFLPASQNMTSSSATSTLRPKTPADRLCCDSRQVSRKAQTPFIPAGASESQSHHARVKSYRHSRRTHSDTLTDKLNSYGFTPRSVRSSPHDNTVNHSYDSSPEAFVSGAKRSLTRPTRRRYFGDGSELASFDDLPTSSLAESKYVKHPSGRGAPKSLVNKIGRSQTIPSRTEPAAPSISGITSKFDGSTPRFARDTNASRIAREQRIASLSFSMKNRDNTVLTPLNSNWKSQTVSRVPSNSGFVKGKKNKITAGSGGKPHLIKGLGTGIQEPKTVNGMHYNPTTCRWEGNENSVQGFDMTSLNSPKPAPALITKVGAMQNVQIVGEMVFDPKRMCWLKLAPQQPGSDSLVAVQDDDDDDDDVFAGLGDLEEKTGGAYRQSSGLLDDPGLAASGDDRSGGDSSDEWPITEEFDVGPEFIRRQRAEEEKWRRKVGKWIDFDREQLGDGWRWAIRDLVRFNSALGSLK